MNSHTKAKTEVFISWTKPKLHWIKVNTDGAVDNLGRATTTGVIRNSDGRWLTGCVHSIGQCSVPMAELWGIATGLSIAWEKGYRSVCFETDSLLAVNLINNPIAPHHPLFSLVSKCQDFLNRNWSIRFYHVFRDANSVADVLVSFAFSFPIGITYFDDPSVCLSSFLSDDILRRTTPRLVCVSSPGPRPFV